MPEPKLTSAQADELLAAMGLPRYGAMVMVGIQELGGPDVIFVYVPGKGPIRQVSAFAGMAVIVEIDVGPIVALAA